jgi:hypothetical protein
VRVPVCEADASIARLEVDGFRFPLGVYPIAPMSPVPGFAEDFEQADGADTEGEWEEWPDRYVFDIVVSADRLPALCRSLLALLPARVFPILDVLGQDAYREIDPYISYELVGLDRFMDGVSKYGAFLFEDGMCGFGAMCDDPFFYLFVDEHKILTIRCEPVVKERVEQVLAAFDLSSVGEPAGADAAAHEHRSVLGSDPARPELLDQEQVVERLRDDWRLTLNIDTDSNQADDGRELGLTYWRSIVRYEGPDRRRYAEVLLVAGSYSDAEEMAVEALSEMEGVEDAEDEAEVIQADRVSATGMSRLSEKTCDEIPAEAGIIRVQWVE